MFGIQTLKKLIVGKYATKVVGTVVRSTLAVTFGYIIAQTDSYSFLAPLAEWLQANKEGLEITIIATLSGIVPYVWGIAEKKDVKVSEQNKDSNRLEVKTFDNFNEGNKILHILNEVSSLRQQLGLGVENVEVLDSLKTEAELVDYVRKNLREIREKLRSKVYYDKFL